jgi:hypothetical protein
MLFKARRGENWVGLPADVALYSTLITCRLRPVNIERDWSGLTQLKQAPRNAASVRGPAQCCGYRPRNPLSSPLHMSATAGSFCPCRTRLYDLTFFLPRGAIRTNAFLGAPVTPVCFPGSP